MKSFNKIVALLLLAVSFSAGAVVSLEEATKFFTDAKTANSEDVCLALEQATGISKWKFYFDKDGYSRVVTADVVKEVVDANTGFIAGTQKVLDSKIVKYLGGAAVLGGTAYFGNKYKAQVGDVSKKLGTKIADGSSYVFNKVHDQAVVTFVKENALKLWNKCPNFKKQVVEVTKQPVKVGFFKKLLGGK